MAALDRFEALVERPMDIVMWYQDWARTAELDLTLFGNVADRGSTPMITWEPWDHLGGHQQPAFHLSRIIAGEFDHHLGSWARGLARFGAKVLLRWAQEMNGNWYPWGVGHSAAEEYREAWQHVWSRFQAERANNVLWVWSPNILDGAEAFEALYPGDEYVDWVGLDGYNWGGWRSRSFDRLFSDSYERLAELTNKPMMIAETACAEGPRKARWIREALGRQLPERYDRVRAVIWFNQRKERDWRVDSSAPSRQAFAASVSGPAYRKDRLGPRHVRESDGFDLGAP